MAKSEISSEEFAEIVGTYANRLCAENGLKIMYVLYVASEVEGDPGLYDKGAVISNLTNTFDIKAALGHAANVYDVDGRNRVIDVELPS